MEDITDNFTINLGNTDSSDGNGYCDSGSDTKDVKSFVWFHSPIMQINKLMFLETSTA
jgi:hypothetical protein